MNMFRVGIVAACTLAAASLLPAESAFGRQWMDRYAENPRPNEVISALYNLSRGDYFESPAHVDTAIGFLSTVCSQNPGAVAGWLREAGRVLPERERRILAAAAWLADSPAAAPALQSLGGRGNDESRLAAAEMLGRSPTASLAQIPVSSVSALSLQWGAYLATGEAQYLNHVFAAFGAGESGVATPARYALVQEALENPRLVAACRAHLDQQPASVRAAFEAAVTNAAPPAPGV